MFIKVTMSIQYLKRLLKEMFVKKIKIKKFEDEINKIYQPT